MPDRPMLLVLSHPVPGREAEYHDWYDRQHLPDVARVPGVSDACRYGTGDPADGYLAVYELDAEPAGVVAELSRRFGTDQMPASGAIDMGMVSMKAWTPLPLPTD